MKPDRPLANDDAIWEWWHKASLPSEVFPLVLDNGKQVDILQTVCERCDGKIEDDLSRIELRNDGVSNYWMRIASLCDVCARMGIKTYLVAPVGETWTMTDISEATPDAFFNGQLGDEKTEPESR